MFHKGSDGKTKGFGFTGFSIAGRQDSNSASGLTGIGTTGNKAMPGRSFGYHLNIGRRKIKNEDDYFDDDDGDSANLEYQPAPGSPGVDDEEEKKKEEDSDSDDPLDAFMANIEEEVRATNDPGSSAKQEKGKDKGQRDDIEEEDDQESYFRYMEENPMAGVVQDDDELEIEYDNDGNPIYKQKIIDPLPPIDHSELEYEPFERNFYHEHEEIEKLTLQQVDELRKKVDIRVSGLNPPKPVTSFAHLGFDDNLIGAIRKAEYTQPTPIQAQGCPVALSGRDMIGIAKTGSGKTAAFLWPLLIHIMDQRELASGEGPVGLILAPTRELSQQIYQEAKKFGKVYNIKVVCTYGGGSMWEQTKACEEGAEIIVATPGRLIDLVKKKATNLQRVTYIVFDEADRMFDMGFEPQVRSIANHVRPDRQTLLFSATFRKKVERLARDILIDPIRVVQGEAGEANQDVTQIVEVLPVGPAKWTWLIKRLVEFTTLGSVLIFVTRKANAEELATNLKARDFKLGLLHGDLSQPERNEVITAFKKREVPILVATDVAARGLDIPSIKVVVNYDVARDIDTHTHRVGRTGRAGRNAIQSARSGIKPTMAAIKSMMEFHQIVCISTELSGYRSDVVDIHFIGILNHLPPLSISTVSSGQSITLHKPGKVRHLDCKQTLSITLREKGFAYSLITEKDKDFAGSLVRNLEGADQQVPKALLDLAMQNLWFKKSRHRQGKGKLLNIGGKVKERPGLGSENSTRLQDSTSYAGFRLGSQGPQQDRVAAMKEAFMSQFKSNFIAASEDNQPKPVHGIIAPLNQASESKKRKKSRWN